MIVQSNIISKTYNDFDLYKLKIHLKIDDDLDVSSEVLQDLWEDSISMIETLINKDVALTTREYIFYDYSGTKVLVDEGNLQSISGVTYLDNQDVWHTVSTYTLLSDSNLFSLIFPQGIQAKELRVKFFSGYPAGQMDKNCRRAALIICNDLRNWEDASYTVQQSNKSDVIQRLLNPMKKRHFINYSRSSGNYYSY